MEDNNSTKESEVEPPDLARARRLSLGAIPLYAKTPEGDYERVHSVGIEDVVSATTNRIVFRAAGPSKLTPINYMGEIVGYQIKRRGLHISAEDLKRIKDYLKDQKFRDNSDEPSNGNGNGAHYSNGRH